MIPNIENCILLCELYGISLDDMFLDYNSSILVPAKNQSRFANEAWLNRIGNRCR